MRFGQCHLYAISFAAAERSLMAFALGWHVYGLLYRSDKNYEEAVKCYRYALKFDKVRFLTVK